MAEGTIHVKLCYVEVDEEKRRESEGSESKASAEELAQNRPLHMDRHYKQPAMTEGMSAGKRCEIWMRLAGKRWADSRTIDVVRNPRIVTLSTQGRCSRCFVEGGMVPVAAE